MLRAIGFGVTRVSVQFVGWEPPSPPFDHMALLVKPMDAPDRYLVDVGCGQISPARPLPLRDGHEEYQPETAHAYRLSRTADGWQYDFRRDGEDWNAQYVVDETPRTQADFLARCRFQDGSPDSHFTQGPICSRIIPGGRITLTGHKMIVTHAGVREERESADGAAWNAALRERFGIDLGVE